MVRRNRACHPCRKRRIRCDETLPSCQQCLRADRACPGPLQGPIIVRMTGIAATHTESAPRSMHHSYPPLPNQLRGPPEHHVMTQLVVAQFLAYFCGSNTGEIGRSWMLRLPDASCNASALKMVELPLQAAALAHFATEAALPGAMMKSNEMYTKALGFHRVFVGQVFCGRHAQISRAFELVSSNIMLAFFEAIQHTSYGAYRVHIIAAASFLEMIGAEHCKAGVLNQLFFSVRAQTAFLSVTMNEPARFASQEWESVPYIGLPSKPTFERVMDIIISVLGVLAVCNDRASSDAGERDITIRRLRSNLETLWNEYSKIHSTKERGIFSEDEIQGCTYRDAISALTRAYFACAFLIIGSVSLVATTSFSSPGDQVSIDSSIAILSCVTYLESKAIGCAYTRMMLPLVLVALKSPWAVQRQCARDKLQSWVAQKKMAGLCTIALYFVKRYDLERIAI